MKHRLKVVWFWAVVVLIVHAFAQPAAAVIQGQTSRQKPDLLVVMDGGEETDYAILVEKKTQQLILYRYDGAYRPVFQAKCSTGEVPGMKTRAGDKKTPEGVYFFTGAFEKKYLSAVYGEMAFPMDYPNLIDRIHGREGNSIWMHGTNKKIKDRDSNGCIVVANADIRKLSDYIRLNRTPIIVTDQIRYTDPDRDRVTKDRLIDVIRKWNDALVHGSYEAYLAFYASPQPIKISWWEEWRRLKEEFRTIQVALETGIENVSIYRHDGVYTALFDHTIQTGDHRERIGTRKMYLQTGAEGIRVLGDRYLASESPDETVSDMAPFITACREIQAYHHAEKEIEAFVDQWIAAWSGKDIETYGNCYASDFRFRWMDRAAWLKKKKRLNRLYSYISVSRENLVIQAGRKRSTATFTQHYESSGYRAVGQKQLILKRENGQWKIYRERWKKS